MLEVAGLEVRYGAVQAVVDACGKIANQGGLLRLQWRARRQHDQSRDGESSHFSRHVLGPWNDGFSDRGCL